MYTVDVDFEVYKQLTLRRATEDVSYNDVIRALLGLGQAKVSKATGAASSKEEDWVVLGVRFPAGTEFRKTYKGKTYTARVQKGAMVLNGQVFSAPSPAAISITGSPTNGWRFWECKLPGSSTWQLIERLRKQ